jgi:arsenate reductase-like glutaredoxin family protein
LSFAKEKSIEYVTISCVENHPKSKRLKEIYKKLGFNKDSETYIKKI